jgi:ADP-ribosyl-[dinitrogen reductase] hydrolase
VTDPHPDDDAAANGSLMRLAPVPIRWHHDVAAAAEGAGESSRTTHPARRTVDACRALGAMTAALIAGTDADAVFDPGFWEFGPLHPDVQGVVRGSWRAKQPPDIRGSGYCMEDKLLAAFRGELLNQANLISSQSQLITAQTRTLLIANVGTVLSLAALAFATAKLS